MRNRVSLALAAMLAGMNVWPITAREDGPQETPEKDDPKRAEMDAAALAKAEAKRQRKAAKRLKSMTPNSK